MLEHLIFLFCDTWVSYYLLMAFGPSCEILFICSFILYKPSSFGSWCLCFIVWSLVGGITLFLYCHFSIFLKFDIMLLHSSFFFKFCNLTVFNYVSFFFVCDVYCIVVKHLNHVMGALEINK